MTEQRTPHQKITSMEQRKVPPAKCQVDIIYNGESNARLDSAKEILIASFVIKLINKGNYGDLC